MITTPGTDSESQRAADIDAGVFQAVRDCLEGIENDDGTSTWSDHVTRLRERLHGPGCSPPS